MDIFWETAIQPVTRGIPRSSNYSPLHAFRIWFSNDEWFCAIEDMFLIQNSRAAALVEFFRHAI